MLAAEQGADYVMFGEPDADWRRPGFEAVLERVAWWAEVFEAPCVGAAAALDEVEALVQAGADFVAIEEAIWRDARRSRRRRNASPPRSRFHDAARDLRRPDRLLLAATPALAQPMQIVPPAAEQAKPASTDRARRRPRRKRRPSGRPRNGPTRRPW